MRKAVALPPRCDIENDEIKTQNGNQNGIEKRRAFREKRKNVEIGKEKQNK
jgi:hypothetical protein